HCRVCGFNIRRLPLRSPHFPYTTLFRSLGLLSACRYRLVTPDVTLAMPEISIGLFPDVGASWFLNRLPGRLGLFMGLTGARLNRSEEHTSELQSREKLVCRLLLEKKKAE